MSSQYKNIQVSISRRMKSAVRSISLRDIALRSIRYFKNHSVVSLRSGLRPDTCVVTDAAHPNLFRIGLI
jgi:hypothetical protein